MPKLITTRTRIADLGKPRVIVIGGGFGGVEVVKALRKEKVQVVLFDKYNHHTFQPLLYQVATSGLETNSIVFPFRKLFGRQADFFFRLADVKKVIPEENCIETSIGSISYDYLVVATGAVTNFYGMKEVEENASFMKNIVDATKLRNKIIRNFEFALLTEDAEVMNSLMDFVIVGGGPTGVELAGALTELKRNVFPKDYPELDMRQMDIYLVQAGDRLLDGMSKQAGDKAHEFLTKMGVKVLLNTAVKGYDGHEVLLSTGEKLMSRSLIWAAGVKGSPIQGLPPESIGRGNRILTDEFSRVKGYKNIFAIGDVALMEGDVKFPQGHPQMAPPSQQQGKLVARNIGNLIRKRELKPFRYLDMGSMATVGRNKAVCDMRGGIRFQGIFAWYVWMFVHLMSIIGFKNKVLTLFSWMISYFTYDRSNRLIIGRNEEKNLQAEIKVDVHGNRLNRIQTLSASGVLVSLGIIYGDIGTSPLYVFRAIIGQNNVITRELVLGGMSCVFWTMVIITTVKYIYLALNADNKGEGGIFALYALVRKFKAGWVIYPAIIGCCMIISDGFITPAFSISAAIEGLTINYPEIPTAPIAIGILIIVFFFQQFGTLVVGKTFGPIMLIWFITIGIFGSIHLVQNPEVLAAINPVYAWRLLSDNTTGGFWILGAVFLCTTGAEAIYSDLGHCGKNNIRVGWVFVFSCLMLNYFGQTAWLLERTGTTLNGTIPFYAIVPEPLLNVSIVIATMAAVIASQALISGTFTLVNEAMKLKLWPSTHVRYPSQVKGQIYLPAINWMLLAGTILVVVVFKSSLNMEGAYGLAITVDMLMTTTLLVYYFRTVKKSTVRFVTLGLLFFTLEGMFLVSNLSKFNHGGWFTFSIATLFFILMFVLLKARNLRDRHTEFVDLKHYITLIQELQADQTVPKEATNLVYMAVADSKRYIDSNIIYSIFKKRPKRADVYWFIHVDTVDSPYTSKYSVDTIIPKKCFFVRIKLGFKADHRVNLLFNKVLHDMAENAEIDLVSHYDSLNRHSMPADFKFIILHSLASVDSETSAFDDLIIQGYRFIKRHSLSTEEIYGLELANVEVERVPIMVGPPAKVHIKREREDIAREKEIRYSEHSK